MLNAGCLLIYYKVARFLKICYIIGGNTEEVVKITLQQQIEMAIAYSGGVTKKEIAEKMNVTPSAFGQRLKTGKFTKEELQRIAAILDAEYISFFKFKDGKEI